MCFLVNGENNNKNLEDREIYNSLETGNVLRRVEVSESKRPHKIAYSGVSILFIYRHERCRCFFRTFNVMKRFRVQVSLLRAKCTYRVFSLLSQVKLERFTHFMSAARATNLKFTSDIEIL